MSKDNHRRMRLRLKALGLMRPESAALDAVIAKEKKRKRPHKHKWRLGTNGVEYCQSPHCDGHRRAT